MIERKAGAIGGRETPSHLTHRSPPWKQPFHSLQQSLRINRVNENPESAPKIDWAFYKSRIGIPGLVDKFQKEYEAVKIDYPADKYTPLIEAQEKEALEVVQKFISDSNARITENQEKIKKLEGMLKYSQMTMEDFKDAHPELAIDPLNNPTIFPHTPEYQPDPEGTEKPAAHH